MIAAISKFHVGMRVSTEFGRGVVIRVLDYSGRGFNQRFYYEVNLLRFGVSHLFGQSELQRRSFAIERDEDSMDREDEELHEVGDGCADSQLDR